MKQKAKKKISKKPYIEVVKKADNSYVLIPVGQDMDKFSDEEIKEALKKALTLSEESSLS